MFTFTMSPQYEKEEQIGDWVTARCRSRDEDHGKEMPSAVSEWLAGNGNPVTKTSRPTSEVLGWLVKTIEDPAWPSS
ncbi:MAG: hypothetical protein JSU63_15140 [Phycisphaerales bacterium]|nr:MAG: hypothetical protein JSU63_15140 [Phycisphaerales bacterium]